MYIHFVQRVLNVDFHKSGLTTVSAFVDLHQQSDLDAYQRQITCDLRARIRKLHQQKQMIALNYVPCELFAQAQRDCWKRARKKKCARSLYAHVF